MTKKTTCSKCEFPLDPHRKGKQRYCNPCHAEYMRITRPKHSELKPEAKFKANVRSKSKYLLKKGIIEKKPCETCGDNCSEMHHPDYTKPIDVTWLCRPCHLTEHNGKLNIIKKSS